MTDIEIARNTKLEKIVDKHNGLIDEDSFSNNLNLDVQLEIELED